MSDAKQGPVLFYDISHDQMRPVMQADVDLMQQYEIGRAHLLELVRRMLARSSISKLGVKERSEIQAVLERVGL